jgi:hypothetical protein
MVRRYRAARHADGRRRSRWRDKRLAVKDINHFVAVFVNPSGAFRPTSGLPKSTRRRTVN